MLHRECEWWKPVARISANVYRYVTLDVIAAKVVVGKSLGAVGKNGPAHGIISSRSSYAGIVVRAAMWN